MKPKQQKHSCPYGLIFDKKLGVCRPVQNDKEWLEMFRRWRLSLWKNMR